MEENKILAELFQIRTQAHWLHLQTSSYAEHKALDGFYNDWLGLVDSFIETYFGRYGKKDGSFLNAVKSYEALPANLLIDNTYNFVSTQLKSIVKASDMDLLNIIADMQGLCNHTKYLLTLK